MTTWTKCSDSLPEREEVEVDIPSYVRGSE